MLYRADDCINPSGNTAEYMSKIIAAHYDKYSEWETQMPARYRQYSGIENFDDEDIDQMRRQTANALHSFIASVTGIPQPRF